MTVAPRFLQSNASSKQRVFKATCLQNNVSWLHGWHLQSNYNRVRAGGQARSASGSSTGEVPGRAKPIGKNVAAAPAPCSSQACAGHLSLISATLCPNPRKKNKAATLDPNLSALVRPAPPQPLASYAHPGVHSVSDSDSVNKFRHRSFHKSRSTLHCWSSAAQACTAGNGHIYMYIYTHMHCERPWANPPGLP